jgi:hypothetical protein
MWDEILDEETELLSALVPDDLALYKHYFVTYWRKYGYHVKRSYELGFAQPKNKKTGKPLYLFNADDCLEKHLDLPRYAAHHYVHDRERYEKFIKNDQQLYWLGLYGGRRPAWRSWTLIIKSRASPRRSASPAGIDSPRTDPGFRSCASVPTSSTPSRSCTIISPVASGRSPPKRWASTPGANMAAPRAPA